MLSAEQRTAAIDKIRTLPAQLTELVSTLSEQQLAMHTPGEWSTRQIVHHLADSHMNAMIRMKLALTEDTPTVKPYDQERWAELADSRKPLDESLMILKGLHARWVALLESVSGAQWARQVMHPVNGLMSMDDLLALYAGHGENHLAQIQTTLATPMTNSLTN